MARSLKMPVDPASDTPVANGRILFFRIILFFAFIDFSGAWLWPPHEFSLTAIEVGKIYGAPYQYFIWFLCLLGAAVHTTKYGTRLIFGSVGLFLPFLLMGALSGLIGYDPLASFHLLVLWMAVAVCAALIGAEIPIECLWRDLRWGFLGLLTASILMSVFVPSIGLVSAEGGAWRGLFVQKNGLGWLSAIALTLSLVPGPRKSRLVSVLLAAEALLCLVKSGSKGSLVVAFGAIGFGWLLRTAQRNKVSPFVFFVLSLVVMVFAVVFVTFGGDFVLQLLGKDATLTGRTVIWQTYFNAMSDYWLFGAGPGAFTTESPITVRLAERLVQFGAIFTPHNFYLGAFGDSGIVGLLILLVTIGSQIFLAPFRRAGLSSQICGLIGFLFLLGGMDETHEVFTAGLTVFLLVLFRAQSLKQSWLERMKGEQNDDFAGRRKSKGRRRQPGGFRVGTGIGGHPGPQRGTVHPVGAAVPDAG